MEALVRTFARDPVLHRALILEQLDKDPAGFLAAAIEILKTDTLTRGIQYVMSLLVSHNLLFEAVCSPTFDRKLALDLARIAVRMDPMADVALARRLADVFVSETDASGLADMGRVMDILGEVSDGTRILPLLMRILRNDNPYVRSKAVLMIGRGGKSVRWVKGRLAESDARVRANAVEALWGVDTEESRELLQFAAHDGNNRVAGNAVLGLYRLGECAAVGELVKMVSHQSAGFRMSAAWAMGETGDPRFSDALGKMLVDPAPGVRKRAFEAVSQIKAAVALVSQGTRWHLAASLGRKDRSKSSGRVSVAVVSGDGHNHPKILPTQFILSEDGTPVLSYKVNERPLPEAMSVVFFLPRLTASVPPPWNRATRQCLSWKRQGDLWCVVPYLPEGGDDADNRPPPEPPPYTAQPAILTQALTAIPSRAECADLWTALWTVVRPENGPPRGKRHLIVFAPLGITRVSGHGLVAGLISSRTSVQIISAEPHTALESLCSQTGGSFQLAGTEAEIEKLISRAYLNLLTRYDISYQPVHSEPTSLKVRVHTTAGWGEVTLPFPHPGNAGNLVAGV